jgi:hypothetical protein
MPKADSSPPGSVAQIRPDEGVSVFDTKNSLSIVRSRGAVTIGRVARTGTHKSDAGTGL